MEVCPSPDQGSVTWLWQRFGSDGRIEKTSEPQETYGKALLSALQQGFQPGVDDYSLDLPSGRMHFPPGRKPEFVAPSEIGEPTKEEPATKRPPARGPTAEK